MTNPPPDERKVDNSVTLSECRVVPGHAGTSRARRSVASCPVALDAATKKVYRRTDSATLTALLPELRRLAKAAQKERERIGREEPDLGGEDEKFAADLAAYEAVSTERELWIRNELKRRGLLPLWPGEEERLDDEA